MGRKVHKPDPHVVAHLEALALRDQLDDLLSGFRWWVTQKTANCSTDMTDEMLIRWVEHNEREDV